MAIERAARHESYYRAVGRAYDARAPELAREWESPSMKLYRTAALQIYHSFLPRPSPGQTEIAMLEYGAGIGRIAGHLFREERFLAGSLLPVRLTAVDLSADSLKMYGNTVRAPFLNVNTVTGNIVQVLENLPKTHVFDTIFSNGAYQIPPDDLSYIINQSMLHLKEGGTMIFDFLPSEGKMQYEVYSEKSPRGDYDTYHYPVGAIRRFIHGGDQSSGYTFRFVRLSELKDEKTGRHYGPLTVPNIEKGSGEKQVDPVYCIIRKALITPEQQESLEKIHADILKKTEDFFGVALPALPVKYRGGPTAYIIDTDNKERYLSVNPAGSDESVRQQFQAAVAAYAVDRITGKKLPGALSGGGLDQAEDPFSRLKVYLNANPYGVDQAIKLLDVHRLLASPESVSGADVTIPGNALIAYIRRSKGERVLREMLLAGLCDAEGQYNNKAEHFFEAAARYYGSVDEFQKGFLRMALGGEAMTAYEKKHPVQSVLKRIFGSVRTFLRGLFR